MTRTNCKRRTKENEKCLWEANRDELMEFWRSGEYTHPDNFPDSLPWLFVRGYPDTLPWAAVHLD